MAYVYLLNESENIFRTVRKQRHVHLNNITPRLYQGCYHHILLDNNVNDLSQHS